MPSRWPSRWRGRAGEAIVLPVARDTVEATRELLGEGLDCDLLLVSGGVSAGRYDVVESVLAGFGAEFYFDRVRIQPGQPCVFGQARGVPVFGLPGNPASTMVCFEVFARARPWSSWPAVGRRCCRSRRRRWPRNSGTSRD